MSSSTEVVWGQLSALLRYQLLYYGAMDQVHELLLAIDDEHPQDRRSLYHLSVDCVDALADGLDVSRQDRQVAVGESDFPPQEDLGSIPYLHPGQLLLLKFKHLQPSLFHLLGQFILQELDPFAEVEQVLSGDRRQCLRRLYGEGSTSARN